MRYTWHTKMGLALATITYVLAWLIVLALRDYTTGIGLIVAAGGMWFAALDERFGPVVQDDAAAALERFRD